MRIEIERDGKTRRDREWKREWKERVRDRETYLLIHTFPMVLYSVNVGSVSVFVFCKSVILWWHSICMQLPQAATAELRPRSKRIFVIFYFQSFYYYNLFFSISNARVRVGITRSTIVVFVASTFHIDQKLYL